MSGGDDFDPCECIWSHEHAMRRLISLLRSSQSYCTDSECINDLPGLPGPPNNESNLLFLTVCWLVLAVVLFVLRPPSLRRQDANKPGDSNQGPGSNPPNPPVAN